jgi:hypothetical protein
MKKTKLSIALTSVIILTNMSIYAADYLARAVVTDTTGPATYSSSMQSGKIVKGLALPQTYTVRTGKDGTVDMILTSGIAVKVMPNTVVGLQTLDIMSEGLPKSDNKDSIKRIALNLKKGSLMVNIPKDTKDISFKVNTKFGTVHAEKPSVFEVSATGSAAEAKAGVGSFKVMTKTKETTVSSGESVIMLGGELQINNVATADILAYAASSLIVLEEVFTKADPGNTQDVIDVIAEVIEITAVETPAETATTTSTPKATEVPLPPEPIKSNDPSPSIPSV